MAGWAGNFGFKATCGVQEADEDDIYAALDWLARNQAAIEERLAARELKDGTIVPYDISSSYYTGSARDAL